MKFLMAILFSVGLVSSASAAKLTVTEAAELLYPSVGTLEVGRSEHCTVTKVGPRQYLTAAHCVTRLKTEIKIQLKSQDGKYEWLRARSVLLGFVMKAEGKDHWEDWAVINVTEDGDAPALPLGCGYEPTIGEPIVYMGFPYTKNTRGLTRLYGVGYVSGVFPKSEKKLGGAFTFDAPGAGGSSGSAVVSLRTGKIIGVLTRVEIGDRDIIGLIAESVDATDLCEDAVEGPEIYGVSPHVDPERRDVPPSPF